MIFSVINCYRISPCCVAVVVVVIVVVDVAIVVIVIVLRVFNCWSHAPHVIGPTFVSHLEIIHRLPSYCIVVSWGNT